MAATTASVSPSRQETTMVNTTPTTTAMRARRCHPRILGSADRWARLPSRWPMPSRRGSPSLATGVTTGSRHDPETLRSSASAAGLSAPSGPSAARGAASRGSSATPAHSQNGTSAASAADSVASTPVPEWPEWSAPGQDASSPGGQDGRSAPGQAPDAAEPDPGRPGPGRPAGDAPRDRAVASGAVTLPAPSGGPGGLWRLSLGHAIGTPPPQRNCLRTRRITPASTGLCPCDAAD